MKALILCAGIGERLLPYTRIRPKPLFFISGAPILDRLIRQLYAAGVEAVLLNTHHLADQIEAHVRKSRYPIPVHLSHEPAILGTGGAIANNAHALGHAPFFVINGDILTDIDFRAVYDRHLARGGPATLVFVNDPAFNTVFVDPEGTVCAFDETDAVSIPKDTVKLTFTGIQVLDDTILDYIPDTGFSSSIDAYRRMLADGKPLWAWVPQKAYWKDIGTPERYRDAALDALAAEAFFKAWPALSPALEPARKSALAGDGSDRTWFRLFRKKKTLAAVHHGIRTDPGPGEMDSWIRIGRFLKSKGIPVPEIHAVDPFSGWAVMEDLGDLSLQEHIRNTPSPEDRVEIYQHVIDQLVRFSTRGIRGFDLTWAYQGPIYNEALILKRECGYFLEAFVHRYLGIAFPGERLENEWQHIARRALENAEFGLMHRDFQSRNIMVAGKGIFFIDFQGARVGPIQYDLASLLIDPYVDLPVFMQEQLLAFAMNRLAEKRSFTLRRFLEGYGCCALCRNLQALGAFAHLSRVKGKTVFETYIPPAVKSLSRLVDALPRSEFPRLHELKSTIAAAVGF